MTRSEIRDLHAAGVITHRELDVLELRHGGMSDRAIALALDISRRAVRDRRKNALRKIALIKEAA